MTCCYRCGEVIDYANVLWKIDLQQWHLNRAIARKLTLCDSCGKRLSEEFLEAKETTS